MEFDSRAPDFNLFLSKNKNKKKIGTCHFNMILYFCSLEGWSYNLFPSVDRITKLVIFLVKEDLQQFTRQDAKRLD